MYGTVCTVVWEGWGREAPPYPDQRNALGLGQKYYLCSPERAFHPISPTGVFRRIPRHIFQVAPVVLL